MPNAPVSLKYKLIGLTFLISPKSFFSIAFLSDFALFNFNIALTK